jgi:hypothetical protein
MNSSAAWGCGDPATTKPSAPALKRHAAYRSRSALARYNDIEFSGERKRVRCNELLGPGWLPRVYYGHEITDHFQ